MMANIAGTYNLTVNTPAGTENYTLDVKSSSSLTMYAKDTLNTKFSFDGKHGKTELCSNDTKTKTTSSDPADTTQRRPGGFPGGFGGGADQHTYLQQLQDLSGISNGTEWNGTGVDSLGNSFTWTASICKSS